MAIHESKKQSDLEKRLRLLRQQVYGKSSDEIRSNQKNLIHQYASTPIPSGKFIKSDLSYLYQDLFKIGFLASLALGTQIVLFYLLQNHILKLNFF